MLEGINEVRKKYLPERIESNLDLTTCNIMDLLRCKCVGRKRDLKRIYQMLQQHPRYEIVRVKVKLNESTRDILINFRCKESFLIAEMQLALGSKDQLNEQFCHYLYELQRSTVPVVYEIAAQMVSGDYRMAYFSTHRQIRFNPPANRTVVRYIDGKVRCC